MQAPLGPTHLSVPAFPRQHEVWLVSHMVFPHGTMPGSHAAPPSGASHVTVFVPPLLAPPSAPALPPPSEVMPGPPPSSLAVVPPLLPPLPLDEPPPLPLPPLLPDPPEPPPELPGWPPSGVTAVSEELHCVIASAAAESRAAAKHPRLRRLHGSSSSLPVRRGQTVTDRSEARNSRSARLLIGSGQFELRVAREDDVAVFFLSRRAGAETPACGARPSSRSARGTSSCRCRA